MYKKKNVDGHMSLEGEKKQTKNGKELKLTKQKNYTSYCLLLLERSWTSVPKLVVWIFFPCCCCFCVCVFLPSWFVPFLWTALK